MSCLRLADEGEGFGQAQVLQGRTLMVGVVADAHGSVLAVIAARHGLPRRSRRLGAGPVVLVLEEVQQVGRFWVDHGRESPLLQFQALNIECGVLLLSGGEYTAGVEDSASARSKSFGSAATALSPDSQSRSTAAFY